jgi:hypothetical protein
MVICSLGSPMTGEYAQTVPQYGPKGRGEPAPADAQS